MLALQSPAMKPSAGKVEENTVTIRYRDNMNQERIKLEDVKKIVMEKII
jgi:glycyl-tRNA synthetase (class II)